MMRAIFDDKVERARIRDGRLGSEPGEPFGAFDLIAPGGVRLLAIVSDGKDVVEAEGWQHVSVSLAHRTPNWTEMAWIKDLFFADDETVLQFHVPRSAHINLHPHCLHLWLPPYKVELPPSLLREP